MFSSSKKVNQTKKVDTQRIDTIIGASTSMTGNVTSSGVIRVDGIYNGDITSKTDVIVGEPGNVKGNIVSENISISGTVEGNVRCTGLLEITPTGKLTGDIEVKSMSIIEGAVFRGKCTMLNGDKSIESAPVEGLLESNQEDNSKKTNKK